MNPPVPRRSPLTAWIGWSAFTTAALVLATVVAQPVWAGLFLTGDIGMLAAHQQGANLATLVLVVDLVLRILWWSPCRGPALGVWLNLALTAALYIQYVLGQDRLLQFHFPLGVGLSLLSAWLVVHSWRSVRRIGGAA
ncbi:MAG TPA: hypothetical protein VE172_02090 [Stackebrandtia sp.]|jgi:hypothetical protein|uniref:hypothetical protein n=1 Tax=Stackebrandtia sp. TaxID=2023065 RepID=UPI002D69BE7F|nr:hypothetical protein [Stackebrandtia sp.]HZE37576.1 hypothetical protein [Stackebrandtia sp.]